MDRWSGLHYGPRRQEMSNCDAGVPTHMEPGLEGCGCLCAMLVGGLLWVLLFMLLGWIG